MFDNICTINIKKKYLILKDNINDRMKSGFKKEENFNKLLASSTFRSFFSIASHINKELLGFPIKTLKINK